MYLGMISSLFNPKMEEKDPMKQCFLPTSKAVVTAFGLAFVAEAEGFEPTHGYSPPGSFQDCSLKPLEYASVFQGENKPRPGSEKNEMKQLD